MDNYEDDVDMLDQDLDQDMGDWHHANAPKNLQNLRACIPCLLVKTYRQWIEEGCENCVDAIDMKDTVNLVNDLTTQDFDGMIALMQPSKSWVARWQFIPEFIPGVYAIKVRGDVSPESAEILTEKGFRNVGKMMQQDDLKLATSKSFGPDN